MKISDSINTGGFSKAGAITTKSANENEYARYLANKYACLKSGKKVSVSVTSGLLCKAMKDEKTGEWLERELSKAPDYIREAGQSAAARGSTLKFVSIEFGEEYSTMCTLTVTDGGGNDPDIDEWLEKVKKKREERKAEEKKQEERTKAHRQESETYKMELKGRDLEDLTRQFTMNLPVPTSIPLTGSFDMKA